MSSFVNRVVLLLSSVGLLSGCNGLNLNSHKHTVGATEVVMVLEANLWFRARVDTGAKSTSINAIDINASYAENPIGIPIEFTVINHLGEISNVKSSVHSIVTVKTTEGSEQRYKVPLTLQWGDSTKQVLVTLNDRSQMRYPMLLGRNWLEGDFVVDVESLY